MSDIVAIKAAEDRLIQSPWLSDMLARQARDLANQARATHPMGAEAIDTEIRESLAAAGKMTGAVQLLAVEGIFRTTQTRLAEAHAEVERQRQEHYRRNLDNQVARAREGCRRAWADRTTAATREAMSVLANRLATIGPAMAAVSDDAGYLDTLADLDLALKSASTTVGIERREARIRVARVTAESDVEALVQAA